MGYRVGHQCFSSQESALDYVMSAVAPVIRSDGMMMMPQKLGRDWVYEGQKIMLSFPECSVSEQMMAGASVAAPFVMIFALMTCFRLVYRFINGMGVSDGG